MHVGDLVLMFCLVLYLLIILMMYYVLSYYDLELTNIHYFDDEFPVYTLCYLYFLEDDGAV